MCQPLVSSSACCFYPHQEIVTAYQLKLCAGILLSLRETKDMVKWVKVLPSHFLNIARIANAV